jgi:membrane-bound ClpP family serine protease
MEWLTVISLIAVGIILVVVEIIFVPGTTVVGLLGGLLAVVGVVLSFSYFGNQTGWYVLAATSVLSGGLLYWSLRSRAWERFSLKTTIDGRVNEIDLNFLKTGDEGSAVSALRPMGKAEIGGKLFEVTSLGIYIETGTRIRIVRVSSNQIVVEPVN